MIRRQLSPCEARIEARAAGECGVQSELNESAVRHELVAMLPRLKRFAEVLIGEREEGLALLGRALRRMLASPHRRQPGTPFDRWAFAEIYRLWLQDLRDHADPMRRAQSGPGFETLLADTGEPPPDSLTLSFIADLPPQQRSALLLVYGEGFSHDEAASVLDCPPDTIEARLIRSSAGLADRLSEPAEPAMPAAVTPLYSQQHAQQRETPR
jgi:RNA polymerase sigma-70 factor, ECF subfamily